MMTLQDLEAKLSRRPHSPLFARVADEYRSAGRLSEAKNLCASGLRRFPAYPTGYLVLAKCYEAERNFGPALDNLIRAIEVLPDAPSLHALMSEWISRVPSVSAIENSAGKREEAVQLQTSEVAAETAVLEEEPVRLQGDQTTARKSPDEEETFPREEKPREPRREGGELPDDGRIVSKTLAEIYAGQGAYQEAILTYTLLKRQRPALGLEFDRRISELRERWQAKKDK